METKEILKITH